MAEEYSTITPDSLAMHEASAPAMAEHDATLVLANRRDHEDMNIRFWGARGSIPVSGPEYTRYGGDTTCVEIRTKDGETIIIDAGTGIRRLGRALLAESRRKVHLVFTHAHWDHLIGFPFFQPIYSPGFEIDLFGCPFAQGSVKELLKGQMSPPYFPVNLSDTKATLHFHDSCIEPFVIGSVRVEPVLLSHPNQGLGYRFTEDGRRFCFITDNELSLKHPGGLEFADYVKFCENADLLVHDAEFNEKEYSWTKGWGHSRYTDALRLASESNVRRFGLFHHNQERSDAAIDDIETDCVNRLHAQKSSVECFAVHQGLELQLQ